MNHDDPPVPLPSEVLGSVDGGRGVAGFVLRPTDLDHLAFLTEVPDRLQPAQPREPIDARTLGRLADLPRQPAQSLQDSRLRPHGGEWPEDGITLTYGELRRLVALHLAQLAHTMPRDRPWLFAETQAQAMADGETPLRLSEVME